jgi:hypothetical protein
MYMASSILNEIDEKKKLKESEVKNTGNNWTSFGLSLISNIMMTLLIGLLGSNFIYMTTANTKTYAIDNLKLSILDMLLPTTEKQYFPLDEKIYTGGSKCSETAEFNTNWKNLNNIGVGSRGSWPYSMYIDDSNLKQKNGYGQLFKNWFATSTADSYIRGRDLLKYWLNIFSPGKDDKNIFANDTFQIFLVAPFMFFMFIFLIIFMYFSSWFSLFKSGWGFTLIGLFLIYSWFITFGITFVQSFQYLFTFMFIPLIADYKRVKKIFGCNVKSLSMFFGLLVCSSAFSYLDNTISITMFVVYLLMILKSFW